MKGRAALGLAVALAGCVGQGAPPPASAATAGLSTGDWRRYASAADRQRLHDWRSAFTAALADARAAGHGAEIAAEGALLQPDAGSGEVALPAGDYRCRVTKLGRRQNWQLAYVAYPYFRCRIGGGEGVRSFDKLTGSQRQVGTLYPDRGGGRLVFLGTLALGDEARALRYGVDEERDLIGAVERIGERRWRMILPYPRFESVIDVMEIVPEQEPR